MYDQICSNSDVKINVLVESHIGCSLSSIEYLQRDFAVILVWAAQLDHCLDPFSYLSLDHSRNS